MADEDTPGIDDSEDGDKVIEKAAKADEESAKAEPQKTKPEPDKTGKPEEVDWKTKFEEKENQFKEYQAGLTPKLQKLSTLEKQLEQLSGKTDSSEKETETPIAEELAEVERDLKWFVDNGYDENSYEVRNLKRTANTLRRQQKQEQVTSESQEETKMVRDYVKKYPKATPEHVNELTAIIVEKQEKRRSIDLLDAEEIWQGRNADKIASQKAQEALTAQEKAGKAKTQTGDFVETKPDEGEEGEYRDIIAPVDDTDFSIPPV